MNSTKSATLALWLTLTFLLGSGLLVMKNQVQTLENRLVSINKDIETDIKTIHILQAEWSHLNSPSRLRKLAEKHILLNPIRAEQIINYSQVPFDYEGGEADKRMLAQRNISTYAARNKELKKLAKFEQ